MFKRIFWVGIGTVLGILAAAKAQSYVRARTPQAAREFVLGPDEENVAQRTLAGLVAQFRTVMDDRENELNQHYINRNSHE